MPKLARRLQPATLLLPCTGAARGSDPTPALPGAQGFGAFAVGECGGDVRLDVVGHAPRREAGSAMKRLRGALCCGFLLMACCCSGALPESPNVVLIIGDDVGWMDFGFMGSDVVHTPHLDRLARASRIAYADRDVWLGDPDWSPDLRMRDLLLPDYIAERAKLAFAVDLVGWRYDAESEPVLE